MNNNLKLMPELNIRRPVSIGVAVILIFFGVLGGWAFTALLSSAVIAPGVVSVDSSRKTIQHLEGGIVSEILIEEGSTVSAAQPIILLDSIKPRSILEQLMARLRGATALEFRLRTERDGLDEIIYPQWLLSDDNPEAQESMDGENLIFKSRKVSMEAKTSIINRRIAEGHEEVKGITGEISAYKKQIGFLADEIVSMQILRDKNFVAKPRMLALQREEADVQGKHSQSLGLRARARERIEEQKLHILNLKAEQDKEVVAALNDVKLEIFDLNERVVAAKDVLERTIIRSPIDGSVVSLKVHTVGGVVAPHEPLMDIVPSNEQLFINAQLNPNDIDVVSVGSHAEVRLSAFNQRNQQPVMGEVISVSADSLSDQRSGVSYYLIKVKLSDQLSTTWNGQTVYPGMHAEVYLETGDRTAISYLIDPLRNSLRRSMREL